MDGNDVNKIVAAIFAAQRCANAANEPDDFMREYEDFLTRLRARNEDAKGKEGAEAAEQMIKANR
jgi:hypothetical protein